MKTGEKIKLLRTQQGLTLEAVGKKVGVGKSTVRKWENGFIANMGRDKIEKLAEAFGVSPNYLISENAVLSDADKDPVTRGDGPGKDQKTQFSRAQQQLIDLFPDLTEADVDVLLATAQAQANSHKLQGAKQ